MKLKLYQVDAFTDHLFGGNPAAVCPLDAWLPDTVMQQMAAENNLAETAFYIPQEGEFALRWFTPTVEVDLCGHATLATAHVLFEIEHYAKPEIGFDTRSGVLTVRKQDDTLAMNFPADTLTPTDLPPEVIDGLGKVSVQEAFRGKSDFLVVLESQDELLSLAPDFRKLGEYRDIRATIVTAPSVVTSGVVTSGQEVDFVSRCFAPQSGIDEDPVTGSAHTTLTPYWARRLGKKQLTAQQLSSRRGTLWCTHLGDRVTIAGHAVTYLAGEIEIPQ